MVAARRLQRRLHSRQRTLSGVAVVFRKLISDFIEGVRYEGVPQALPKQKTVIRSRSGGLTAGQIAWCDAKLGNGVFQDARTRAEASRGMKS